MIDWRTIAEPVPGHRRAGDGPSVVLLHGFTQTGLSWTPVAEHLPSSFDLVAPDAPGHGESSDTSSTIAEQARLLGERLPVSFHVGYSMGGRTALHVALAYPERVRGLILIGATPGIVDPEERAARRRADDELARRLLSSPLDDFLEDWLTQPLFRTLSRSAWNLDDRRRNRREGLAASLRLAGTGSQDDLWPRLGGLACPTLLVTGELDLKFTAIARDMVAASPSWVRHEVVPGTGHAVHLEDPQRIAAIVTEFVAERS